MIEGGMRTLWLAIGLALSVGVACGGDDAAPKLALGETCTGNAQCDSGMCFTSPENVSYCSISCAGAESVCGDAEINMYCGTEQVCELPCTGGIRGEGTATLGCFDGVFAACAGMNAADACAECGCAPFGGGTCTTVGCFTRMPDGSPCTHHLGCVSQVCNSDTSTCGSARALGEPCGDDFECDTLHCSNDGDVNALGVCFQEFKSPCLTPNPTTCGTCIDAAIGPVCWREFCNEDPRVMANCPDFANQQWGCAADSDGRHRCRVRCDYFNNGGCDTFEDCGTDGFCR